MYLKTPPVELRGVANKVNKDHKPYYMVNVEEEDGTAYSLYCENASVFGEGLKKCDKVIVTFDAFRVGYDWKMSVVSVDKVGV